MYEIFTEEVGEILADFKAWIPQWDQERENTELLTDIRRAFHTCKGSGRMVGGLALGDYAWAHENMLNQVLEGRLPRNDNLATLLHTAADFLEQNKPFFLTAQESSADSQAAIDLVEQFAVDPEMSLPESTSAAPEQVMLFEPDASLPDAPVELIDSMQSSPAEGGNISESVDLAEFSDETEALVQEAQAVSGEGMSTEPDDSAMPATEIDFSADVPVLEDLGDFNQEDPKHEETPVTAHTLEMVEWGVESADVSDNSPEEEEVISVQGGSAIEPALELVSIEPEERSGFADDIGEPGVQEDASFTALEFDEFSFASNQ
ncbi:MAG: Hpt domain-containing protein, partial [Thiolinea sp.]